MSANTSLTGDVISTTYVQLLHIGDTAGLEAAGTGHYICDGDGEVSALSLDVGRVGIGTTAPSCPFHVLQGNVELTAVFQNTHANGVEIQLINHSEEAFIKMDGLGGAGKLSLGFVGGAPHAGNLNILSTGKVGIGTAAPDKNLHIEAASGANIALTSTDTAGVDGDDLGNIYFGLNDSGVSAGYSYGALIRAEASGEWGTADNVYDSPGELQFFIQNDGTGNGMSAPAMTINYLGKVGIGTTSPATLLHVESSTADKPSILIRNTSTSNQEGGNLLFDNAKTDGFLADNAILGEIEFRQWDDTDEDFIPSAKIGARTDGTSATNDSPGEIYFETTPDTGVSATVQRMCIRSSGHVGIGAIAPGYQLDVVDTHATDTVARIYADNTGAATSILLLKNKHGGNPVNGNVYIAFGDNDSDALDTIRGDGLGGIDSTMTITSDSRIKENISNLAGGLDKINALRPVSFNYTDDYLSGNMQYTTAKDWWKDTTVGFVAQEVREQLPVCVKTTTEVVQDDVVYDGESKISGDEIEILKLDLTRNQVFQAYLVKAVQELSAKVTALENA